MAVLRGSDLAEAARLRWGAATCHSRHNSLIHEFLGLVARMKLPARRDRYWQ